MKLSYSTISAWLSTHAAACSLAQLKHLEQIIIVAQEQAKTRESHAQQALEKANAAAREAGFSSLADLLRASGMQQERPLAEGRFERSGVRKPHLDPLDPQPQEAWALTKCKELPIWAQKRLAEGWTIQELHYKNHKKALAARSLKPLYDAVKMHSELIAKEPTRYR